MAYSGHDWRGARSEGKWTQQGAKLTGKEETGDAEFGGSVALSSDGNTALIGGRRYLLCGAVLAGAV
jgi:hypothetical protein